MNIAVLTYQKFNIILFMHFVYSIIHWNNLETVPNSTLSHSLVLGEIEWESNPFTLLEDITNQLLDFQHSNASNGL